MMDFIEKGGVLMYPILAGSVITFAVGLERAYHFVRARHGVGFISDIRRSIGEKQFGQALIRAEEGHGPVAAVIAEVMRHRGYPVEVTEEAVSMRGSYELKRMNEKLHILELIGRIAPLLGLLGTVVGMVEAFRAVAAAKGAVDPSLLADGIWEALITTVAGLCVAIPTLILHHFFEDQVKNAAFLMKHNAAEIIKLLTEKQ